MTRWTAPLVSLATVLLVLGGVVIVLRGEPVPPAVIGYFMLSYGVSVLNSWRAQSHLQRLEERLAKLEQRGPQPSRGYQQHYPFA